ncbi:uncharacterized protein B0T23DRAFT_386777 [Neurospora hispaniola]|uniref:Uncharacterized protein n=1 Tax=Neurospora hispaniola TaxID=588809 RepID=A0AAJ0I203_9PEZI|nr:hypothetical protein B0T23DRAFT_386777 [Neurospora hispaniola]
MTTLPLNPPKAQVPLLSSSSSPSLSQSRTKHLTSVPKAAMPPSPTMTLDPSYCHPVFFTPRLRRSPSFTLQKPGPSGASSSHAVSPVVHGYMFQDAQRLQKQGVVSLGNMAIGSAKVAGGSSRL